MVANIDKNIGAIYAFLKECCKKVADQLQSTLEATASAGSSLGGGLSGGSGSGVAGMGSQGAAAAAAAAAGAVSSAGEAAEKAVQRAVSNIVPMIEPPIPTSVEGYYRSVDRNTGRYEFRQHSWVDRMAQAMKKKKTFGGRLARGGAALINKYYEVGENGVGELFRVGKKLFLMPGASGEVIPPISAANAGVPQSYNELSYNIGRRLEAMVANIDKNIGAIYELLKECCKNIGKSLEDSLSKADDLSSSLSGALGGSGGVGNTGMGLSGAVGGFGGSGGQKAVDVASEAAKKVVGKISDLVEPPIPTSVSGYYRAMGTGTGLDAGYDLRRKTWVDRMAREYNKKKSFGGFLAKGGVTELGKVYRVGEEVPELLRTASGKQFLIPSEHGHVSPLGMTPPQAIQVSNTTHVNVRQGDINVTVNGAQGDPQEIAQAVRQEIGELLSTQTRRAATTLAGAGRI